MRVLSGLRRRRTKSECGEKTRSWRSNGGVEEKGRDACGVLVSRKKKRTKNNYISDWGTSITSQTLTMSEYRKDVNHAH